MTEQQFMVQGEPMISYSIKDILGRVEGKLDAALIAVATKAEHRDLVNLADRVAKLELAEQTKAVSRKWRHEWRAFLWPTVLSAGMLAVTIIQLIR